MYFLLRNINQGSTYYGSPLTKPVEMATDGFKTPFNVVRQASQNHKDCTKS